MLSEVARLLKITIVGGSIPERSDDRLYNTCCILDSDGTLKAKHRKVVFLNHKLIKIVAMSLLKYLKT